MPVRMIGRLARLAMPPTDYTGAARDGEGNGNLMGKRRNQHPQQLQDNIFAGNLFFDDLLAWRHSPGHWLVFARGRVRRRGRVPTELEFSRWLAHGWQQATGNRQQSVIYLFTVW
jgi:hypothetical protein